MRWKGWRMSCDVVKRRKGWRMSCDVGEVTERLENEFCYDYNYELCWLSNLSVTAPTSQLYLQSFRRFTYVTAHFPTVPLLHLRHSSFSNPSFASPTAQALHLIHLASRPCFIQNYGDPDSLASVCLFVSQSVKNGCLDFDQTWYP